MQRLMFGKGGKKKMSGVEPIEVEKGWGMNDEDEDELDSRKGRRRSPVNQVADERTYKPRQYKWKLDRKR